MSHDIAIEHLRDLPQGNRVQQIFTRVAKALASLPILWRMTKVVIDATGIQREYRSFLFQYRGLRVSIEQEPLDVYIDEDDRARSALDRQEASLRRWIEVVGKPPLSVSDFVQEIEQVIAELHALKGAIQAHDANVDSLRLAGKRAAYSDAASLKEAIDQLA